MLSGGILKRACLEEKGGEIVLQTPASVLSPSTSPANFLPTAACGKDDLRHMYKQACPVYRSISMCVIGS